MLTRRIQDATHSLVPNPAFNQQPNSKCGALVVRKAFDHVQHKPIYQSAWEPTPAELEILNRGGSVVLSCLGSQPPVTLTAELAEEKVDG